MNEPVHVEVFEDTDPVFDEVNHIRAVSRDGVSQAMVAVRWQKSTGPARALMLLARCAVDVLVRARKSKPVQVLAKEAGDA